MEENKDKQSEIDPHAPLPQEKFVKSYESGRSLIRMMIVFIVVLILSLVGYIFKDALSGAFESFFERVDVESKKTVTIAYAEGVTSFDPANYETRNRNFFGNIYEGLTRFDKNLSVESALALSWGQIDDYTWEFKLRENVVFHDGSDFEGGDVVVSLDYAMNSETSQLASLLTSIESVEVKDSHTVHITTDVPDPVLPNKLAQVYIFPSENTDFENNLIGTGPYSPVTYDVYDSGDVLQKLTLNAYEYYWGYYPTYEVVNLVNIPGKEARKDALINGEVDLLVNVSSDVVSDLENAGLELVSWPSLEVNFLLFNTSALFGEKDLREAMAMAIDKEGFVALLKGYADVSEQFVSVGVSGYDSSIVGLDHDPQSAEEIFEEYGVTMVEVDMAQGLEFLGGYVVEELSEIGVDVQVNYWDLGSYQQGISDDLFDVYFLGYKTELGDALDMYETIFYSDGAYNGGYFSLEVDSLIEDVSDESDLGVRIASLKQIMTALIEDVAGIPLFESEVIYGVDSEVDFSPRMDGYVFASSLK